MSKCITALSLFCFIILPITSTAVPVLASVGFNSLPGHTLPTGQLLPNSKKVVLDTTNCVDASGSLTNPMIGRQKTICPADYVAVENDLVGLQGGSVGITKSYLRCCKENLVWIN